MCPGIGRVRILRFPDMGYKDTEDGYETGTEEKNGDTGARLSCIKEEVQ